MSRLTPDELAALRSGDAAAVDRLYRENARQVLAWVIRLGGPSLDAEDVAQDVFATALRKVGGFRGDAATSTWLFAITRHVVYNARRRAAFRRFLGLESAPEPVDAGSGPDEEADARRRRRRVQEILESLSDAHREVLVVVDLDERTAPEAAPILGVPVGTVYSRLHAARRAFAEALAVSGASEDDVPALARRIR